MLAQARNAETHFLGHSRSLYLFPCVVMLITSLLTFPNFFGDFMSLSPRRAVNDLFSTGILAMHTLSHYCRSTIQSSYTLDVQESLITKLQKGTGLYTPYSSRSLT